MKPSDYLCSCGTQFPNTLGRYGCPNCHGEGKAKPIPPIKVPRLLEVPDSSNVSALGYDVEALRLFLRFKSGELYAYENVAPKLIGELLSSASIGQAARVITGAPDVFPATKIPAATTSEVPPPKAGEPRRRRDRVLLSKAKSSGVGDAMKEGNQ